MTLFTVWKSINVYLFARHTLCIAVPKTGQKFCKIQKTMLIKEVFFKVNNYLMGFFTKGL